MKARAIGDHAAGGGYAQLTTDGASSRGADIINHPLEVADRINRALTPFAEESTSTP
jgi:hypothetical protein